MMPRLLRKLGLACPPRSAAAPLTELTLTLASQHTASNIFDVFVFSNDGVLTLVTSSGGQTSGAAAASPAAAAPPRTAPPATTT